MPPNWIHNENVLFSPVFYPLLHKILVQTQEKAEQSRWNNFQSGMITLRLGNGADPIDMSPYQVWILCQKYNVNDWMNLNCNLVFNPMRINNNNIEFYFTTKCFSLHSKMPPRSSSTIFKSKFKWEDGILEDGQFAPP